MTRKELGAILKGAARPFLFYSGTVSFMVGMFNVGVTEGKLTILAGILMVLVGARSYDKANAPPPE